MSKYKGEAECPNCRRPIEFTYGPDEVSDYDGRLDGTFECGCGQVVTIEYDYDTPSFYAFKVVE